ncbi:amine oxidase protein family [Synechococcus sp. A18-25c]|uniref:flavin monoamine oxidase family protein n=1 Tax=Synechococcus sp. A18-25c TaxID=1866938 RepID=UPI001648257F|nr:FAD-dependent oxidoreductase [Synechococcus sp. A18-25c]QNJ19258.1 amine oxidase protein family [Synechococcus sp. A18-25c]
MDQVDITIVSAGLSGLIAAREAKKKGYSVKVLEARSRVGGRMFNQITPSGGIIDLGGQWGGHTHHRLEQLTDELGLQRHPSFYDGKGVFIWDGEKSIADISIMPGEVESIGFFIARGLNINLEEKTSAINLWNKLLAISKTINPSQPWLAADAEILDKTTVSHWLEQNNASRLAQWLFAYNCTGGTGTGGYEPCESSILHLALGQNVAPQSGGGEEWLITKGAGEVAKLLGEEMREDIELSAPVQEITQTGDGLEVFYGYGANKSISSNAAIVAIPPVLRQKITFNPGLESEYRQFIQRSPMGTKFKVLAVYKEAFWREQGFCGAGQGNLKLLEQTADSGPPETSPGILASFVSGHRASQLNRLPDLEQRRLILEDLVRYWGPKAAEPLDLVVQRWIDEQWTTGGYTAFRTPGAWTGFGTTWQQPHGRIFWAGTEESTRWPGYFEGAIEAGIQAVDRAAAALDGGGN